MTYLWVALGSALGGVGRYWISGLIARSIGEVFPWGTLVVNVSGSFLIGFVAFLTASEGRFLIHPDARAFILIGICGGYTTFSSFSLQTLMLLRDGDVFRASAYIMVSVAVCMAGVWLGAMLGMLLNR